METTFMSHVARRKLNFQQLENALGTPLPGVIKGYATLGDAKLAESSYDKVVMWTGGSYDYDDVVRALVPGSEFWTQPTVDRPHWNEILDALQEEVDFCEDGETTIARCGAIAIPGAFYITDDGQEAIEENEVPQILLQARPAFRHPRYGAVREDLNVAQKSRGFFGCRRGASGRDQGSRMKRSSIQQLKLRKRCAKCRKLGHWAHECPEGNRGQRNDERYDRRAMRSGENLKGFITVAKHTERRPFFLGASWTFVTLDPGEVLWDTGAQEGLVGKQQLDKWYKLLAEHGRQVEWSQEKPESACGIGGVTQPIGVVSGHTVIRANLIPMVGSFQKPRNCVRTTIKESQQITCQSSLTCTRDPDARTTTHQQETMTQHPHAVADHGRKHRTATELQDLIRQSFPPHHLGSRVVNKRTVLFKTMSGIYGRALSATSPAETQRHGTLWTIKQWKRLAHYTLYELCAAFFDTLAREFGRSEDIQFALQRRERREMKNKKGNVANFLEAQWVRGKSLTER